MGLLIEFIKSECVKEGFPKKLREKLKDPVYKDQINRTDEKGITPLMHIAKYGTVAAAKVLVEAGAKVVIREIDINYLESTNANSTIEKSALAVASTHDMRDYLRKEWARERREENPKKENFNSPGAQIFQNPLAAGPRQLNFIGNPMYRPTNTVRMTQAANPSVCTHSKRPGSKGICTIL